MSRKKRFVAAAIPALAIMVAASGAVGLGQVGSASAADPVRGQEIDHRKATPAFDDADAGEDHRTGSVRPNQRVARAGQGHDVRYNMFGTAASIVSRDSLTITDERFGGKPQDAARDFLRANTALIGISAAQVDQLEVARVYQADDAGAFVRFEQHVGGLPLEGGGAGTVGVRDGQIVSFQGTFTPNTQEPATATVTKSEAIGVAAKAAALKVSKVSESVVEQTVVPVPGGAPRRAFAVTVYGGGLAPVARKTTVDAVTGKALLEENLVHFDADNPRWAVFPAAPEMDGSNEDTREIWCWSEAEGCDRVVGDNPASPVAWDQMPDGVRPAAPFEGNNAKATDGQFNALIVLPLGAGRDLHAQDDRNYVYDWSNQWSEEGCNPEMFEATEQNPWGPGGKADIDAAATNLFVHHNLMHDWTYNLGLTEQTGALQFHNFGKGGLERDYEVGVTQSGAINGGVESGFAGRNNANQVSTDDGKSGLSNMYMWQPTPGYYSKCRDGDFDASIIAHEYGHASSGRAVKGWVSHQGGAMNESNSDLQALQYHVDNGLGPESINREGLSLAQYVNGQENGLRNFTMPTQPFNYSNVGYEVGGPAVHSDGEIWTGTQWDIRQAFNEEYGYGTRQELMDCGVDKTPVDQCPGSRRWIQLLFDSWFSMADGNMSMLDARDAMIAADNVRFGGANNDLLWKHFANRGLGASAASVNGDDTDPKPGFDLPEGNATVTLVPGGNGAKKPVRFFIGEFTQGSTPVADTDPATPLGNKVTLAPGDYPVIAVGAGQMQTRYRLRVPDAQSQRVTIGMKRNLTATKAGGKIIGGNFGYRANHVFDGQEGTFGLRSGDPRKGRLIVDLAGTKPMPIKRIQVSAMIQGTGLGGLSRFGVVRSFDVLTCTASAKTKCTKPAQFKRAYSSPDDAFPGSRPRPNVGETRMRTFVMPTAKKATHVMFQVRDNQCTGNPEYAGEQDQDDRYTTDCQAGSTLDDAVALSEFQVSR